MTHPSSTAILIQCIYFVVYWLVFNRTLSIYALAIAFVRTNVPLSSEGTWTLFHHPQLNEGLILDEHAIFRRLPLIW